VLTKIFHLSVGDRPAAATRSGDDRADAEEAAD